jgi:integrase
MESSTVRTVDIEQWVRGAGWKARTQRSYLGELSRLFKWGMNAGAVVRNPCDGVKVDVRGDEAEISCMSPEQALALLREAREHYADFVAYVVLGVFCGLRSIEIERLDAGAVSLEDGVVIVGAATAKTRSRRVVKIAPNAVKWLRLWVPSVAGRVLPFSW